MTPERLDLTGSQAVLAERGEQLGGLGQRQRQIALAELGQPGPAPPPADRQARVDPARQQHPRASGEMLDDEAEILGDLRALQVVHVLEHDDERTVTADQAVSSRSRNSDGNRCTSVADAAAWAKAPGTARSRARTNVSQKRSGRSSWASRVTHSRATGSKVPNHCATDTVFPVAGPPVTSATRQSGWARTSPRRGRAIARTGTAGHPNFERGTESGPPPGTTRARNTHPCDHNAGLTS